MANLNFWAGPARSWGPGRLQALLCGIRSRTGIVKAATVLSVGRQLGRQLLGLTFTSLGWDGWLVVEMNHRPRARLVREASGTWAMTRRWAAHQSATRHNDNRAGMPLESCLYDASRPQNLELRPLSSAACACPWSVPCPSRRTKPDVVSRQAWMRPRPIMAVMPKHRVLQLDRQPTAGGAPTKCRRPAAIKELTVPVTVICSLLQVAVRADQQ